MGLRRLSLGVDNVFLELLQRLFVVQLFAVKSYPIFVVWGNSVRAGQNIVYVVLVKTHSVKYRICKRSPVLEYPAGKEIIYIGDVQRALYGGEHLLLVFGDYVVGYPFFLVHKVGAYLCVLH